MLAGHKKIELVGSDVSLGPDTMLVCDAHDITVADGSFDGIIVQAVLEHVADPYRCAEEITECLKRRYCVCGDAIYAAGA